MRFLKATLAALCLSATAASAAPVKWDVNFNNGIGSAVGSFTYDADLDIYSSIAITLTDIGAGASSSANTAVSQNINMLPSNEVIFGSTGLDRTNTYELYLEPLGLFSNAGGSVGLRVLTISRCSNAACSGIQGVTGGVSGFGVSTLQGTPVSAAVPLPGAGVLLAGALGLLG